MLEFAGLLLIVCLPYFYIEVRLLEAWNHGNDEDIRNLVNSLLVYLGFLATPLIYFIGRNTAETASHIPDLLADSAGRRLRSRLLSGVLMLVLVGQVGGYFYYFVEKGRCLYRDLTGDCAAISYKSFFGALGVLIIVALAWWLFARRRSNTPGAALGIDQVVKKADGVAVPLIVIWSLFELLFPLSIMIAYCIHRTWGGRFDSFFDANFWLFYDVRTYSVAVLAVVAAFWASRRSHDALSLFLFVFGGVTLWFWLQQWEIPGFHPLGGLDWRGWALVDFWWVLLFTLVGLFWLVRRRLTTERIHGLLFLALAVAFLRYLAILATSESTGPILEWFTSRFGFFDDVNLLILVGGIAWGYLVIGSWANASSPGLSKLSRILLYQGYILLSITVLTYYISTGSLEQVKSSSDQQIAVGFIIFGRPLVYAIFAITLMLLIANENVEEAPPART
jgi:hypothetical protein